MKFFLSALVISVCCLSACDKKANTNQSTSTDAPGGANKLSEELRSQGWENLFNGNNLEGWRFFKNRENNSWEVVSGLLHVRPFDSAELRSDIITVEQYDNFELAFDWKVSEQANTGVMFRVSEEFEEPYFTGPEYQVLDDAGYPGETMSWQLSGANYGMHAPPDNKLIYPQGEWNNAKLVVNGDSVEHWLNGKKLFSYQLNSEEWKKRKQESKWKDELRYGQESKGHIVFQDHKQEAWFRNIFIKPL